MTNKTKHNNQNGDTIVEVLLAITILAVALGSAFVISARSRNTIQANAERYQAQLLANGQADSIKYYYTTHPNPDIPFSPFCIYEGMLQSATSASCTNGLYNIRDYNNISDSALGANLFKIQITWNSLVFNGQDNVELVYGT